MSQILKLIVAQLLNPVFLYLSRCTNERIQGVSVHARKLLYQHYRVRGMSFALTPKLVEGKSQSGRFGDAIYLVYVTNQNTAWRMSNLKSSYFTDRAFSFSP
jgi:hypothetical protein